jgi:hypothetical protein
LVRHLRYRIDEDARHRDRFGMYGTPFRQLLDLGDHSTAAVLGGHRLVQQPDRERLLFDGQVPVLVCRCGPDDGDVDRQCLIVQVLYIIHLHDPHYVLGRAGGELTPSHPGVQERL